MYLIDEDRMGNILLSHSIVKANILFQFESDKDAIREYLKTNEIEDLDNGYTIKINDNEPRASALQEYFAKD